MGSHSACTCRLISFKVDPLQLHDISQLAIITKWIPANEAKMTLQAEAEQSLMKMRIVLAVGLCLQI